jgi:uncharacterized protein with PQ loop repeat
VDNYQFYCESSRILMAVANMSLTMGLFSQCWRLYRTKSTKSITLGLVVSLSLQRMILLNYGIAIQEWPTILGAAMNLPIIALIAIGYWRFRGRGPAAGESPATSEPAQARTAVRHNNGWSTLSMDATVSDVRGGSMRGAMGRSYSRNVATEQTLLQVADYKVLTARDGIPMAAIPE